LIDRESRDDLMSSLHETDGQSTSQNINGLVEAVRALGERARFLAVNLAVVAARFKKHGINSTGLNEDILDLVARITRASQDVNDAVTAMESGRRPGEPTSPGLWVSWRELGVPDETTLEQLTRSLNETLELSRYVFRLIREKTESGRHRPKRRSSSKLTWSDDVVDGDTT
jgi:hypothetical protein